jgi:hypothetical protein
MINPLIRRRNVVHDEQLDRVLTELGELEDRAARVILRPPRSSRAERLAALMNWLLYGRWPGEPKGPASVD